MHVVKHEFPTVGQSIDFTVNTYNWLNERADLFGYMIITSTKHGGNSSVLLCPALELYHQLTGETLNEQDLVHVACAKGNGLVLMSYRTQSENVVLVAFEELSNAIEFKLTIPLP